MTAILPEPADDDNILVSSQPASKSKKTKRQKSHNKNTFRFMIALVVIAVACLLAAFAYDYSHNRAQDRTRKQDLTYISNVVNSYFGLNGNYPTLHQINSSTFSAFAPNLDRSKFTTPDSTSVQLVAYPSDSNYAYQTLPSGCNNTTIQCTGYKLIAVLNDGSQYTVSSVKLN